MKRHPFQMDERGFTLTEVIIASMVGAGGLGNDVLASIQRLDIGLGFESGMAVVLLAIILDRITESFGTPRPARGALRAWFDRLFTSRSTTQDPS